MWVASVDYFEDVRIGKEILAGTSDVSQAAQHLPLSARRARRLAMRRRRSVADMPELERYALHLLATLDAELRGAAEFRVQPLHRAR
jgi:isoleucyl-tRNA synthetase